MALRCETRLACTEAYTFYQYLEEGSKAKIPKKLVDYLNKNNFEPLKPKLQVGIPINEQPISKQGWSLIKEINKYI